MKGRTVLVTDNNTEKALRKFKKLIADSGILQTVKEKQEYVKPTTQRKIARGQAVRRWKKYLRDQELPKKNF